MRGWLFCLAWGSATLSAGAARAQALSLEMVVKTALARNERAEIADQSLVSADAAVSKARAAFLPSAPQRAAGEPLRRGHCARISPARVERWWHAAILGYSSGTMSSSLPSRSSLPAADARLVAPESRYEIEDGRVKYVAPADEPHGTRHSKISALLEAHARDDFEVASDMLTRTSEFDDMAPDVSVFPRQRDEGGGRQLEHLAFEVASTESLSEAGRKANKLMGRGVRRVFVIDVTRQRAFEWSLEQRAFRSLERDSAIEDRVLAAPLPIEALVHAAKTDDAVARALLAKQNPVLEAALATRRAEGELAGLAEGKLAGMAEALIAVLTARGFTLEPAQSARVLAERDTTTACRWLSGAATCTSICELLDG